MQTVIITGANGNLGTTVTETFLKSGYRVLATVAKETMLTDLPQHPQLVAQVIDLIDEEAVAAWIDRVWNEYGSIHGALMLAGGFAMGGIDATPAAAIQQQVALNFSTAYHVARPLFSKMYEAGQGRMVFIGARPALEPDQGKNMLAYGLSKSMLFKLAEYLNAAAKGKDIAVSVVAPSTIDTPANRAAMPDADPGKWVSREKLAATLLFLFSDAASIIREPVVKVYNNA